MTAPLAATSDADLLAAHCAGDAEAFGELFRRHRDRMWAVALRTTPQRPSTGTRDDLPPTAAQPAPDTRNALQKLADRFRG